MDAISDYKVKALDSMQKTVDVLTTEVGRAKQYLDRARQAEVAAVLPEPGPDGVVKLLPRSTS